MAVASGVFNANTGNPAELNARSFAGTVLRRFPNGAAPMFALTSQGGKSKAKASTHGYFSKTLTFQVVTTTATQLVGDVTFAAWPSTVGVVPGMLFWNNRTFEVIRITTVNSGVSVTVVRGFGRVAAAAVNIGDKWVQAGTAFEEGSNRPTARRLTTEYIPNYTQIFRNAWAMTDTARASYAEMGISNIAENKADCMMFHSVDIESAMIFSQPKMDTSGATPMHATQGILDALRQYVPGNVNAAGGTTTFDQLVALVEVAFLYSTNLGSAKERVGFVDNQAMKVLNAIGRRSGQITMMTKESRFGMKYTSFEFYNGTIDLIIHPLLNGLQQTGTMLVMDMPALKLAYMDGRDTIPESYTTVSSSDSNGVDGQGGSLTTELAVELINPAACCLVTGLTSGIA
ncbi:predicted protein [Nematostella vectensis]|uniref:Major capsid protein n=1 Tax=Nematostella vectensis TaxID=45351 RepID=A7T4I9_NEMVE|nr:predicted protein [Nematostella vectensis]|eukprot:XP_001621225.1 hypothetical protein NEMVEDRAFT_v1g222228 [Nematostella vectensis]